MPPESSKRSDMEVTIRAENVVRRFGAFVAVDDVSLEIRRGEVFGLIGHNGAGKSTMFKMMLGLLKPTSGHISIHGVPVDGAGAREVRRSIGYLPENVTLWDNLNGLETLQFFAKLKRIDDSECPGLMERVGLGHAGSRPVRAYSKGMRQRLGFAQALMGQPQVLFLDEPTTGLDPYAIHFFWDTLAELRDQGLTIVLTSHILAELQNRIDRVAVLANGKLQAMGSVQDLRAGFDLPITIQAQLSEADNPAMRQALLAGLPPELAACPQEWLTNQVSFQVPRTHKSALLQHLLRQPEQVQDIQIVEPSLEDMFFGVEDSRKAPAARMQTGGQA